MKYKADPSKVTDIEVAHHAQYEIDGKVYSIYERNQVIYRLKYKDGSEWCYFVNNGDTETLLAVRSTKPLVVLKWWQKAILFISRFRF